MKAEDLYNLYVLSKSGKLNAAAFWKQLFSTDGIFNMTEFVSKQEDRQSD